jgi:hypothetical protein
MIVFVEAVRRGFSERGAATSVLVVIAAAAVLVRIRHAQERLQNPVVGEPVHACYLVATRSLRLTRARACARVTVSKVFFL